jgi:hypothetical protein
VLIVPIPGLRWDGRARLVNNVVLAVGVSAGGDLWVGRWILSDPLRLVGDRHAARGYQKATSLTVNGRDQRAGRATSSCAGRQSEVCPRAWPAGWAGRAPLICPPLPNASTSSESAITDAAVRVQSSLVFRGSYKFCNSPVPGDFVDIFQAQVFQLPHDRWLAEQFCN